MKKILVTGKADKRLVTYPLSFFANYAGKTLIVTDDVNYKRLYGGYEDEGELDNVTIRIIDQIKTNEDLSMITNEAEGFGYDILIYILDAHTLDADFTYTFIVGQQIQTFLGVDIEEILDDTPNTMAISVTLGKRPSAPNVNTYIWTMDDFFYFSMVEEMRMLLPPKNKKLNQLLRGHICLALDINSSAYDGIITKAMKGRN